MISKIITEDIFTTNKQESEVGINIVCWTNKSGLNNSKWPSVAGEIAASYHSDFNNLWKANLWEVHKRIITLSDETNATVYWIVCSGNSSKWISDWTLASSNVKKGFNHIKENTQLFSKDIETHSLDCLKRGINNGTMDSIEHVENFINLTKNLVNPIVRSVLIGTGKSWQINNADIAAILTAMQESNANIHLYLNTLLQQAQVAKVIPLFPEISTLAATDGYNDILPLKRIANITN